MSDRAPGLEPDRRTHDHEEDATLPERRSGRDRRRDRRVRLSLEIAVPVRVSGPGFDGRGMARNISEGGMLVELSEAPPIGMRVSVSFEGIRGSADAPGPVELRGEVRHHMAWQYTARGMAFQLKGVGIRFLDEPDTEVSEEPLTSWVWRTGHTLH